MSGSVPCGSPIVQCPRKGSSDVRTLAKHRVIHQHLRRSCWHHELRMGQKYESLHVKGLADIAQKFYFLYFVIDFVGIIFIYCFFVETYV